MDILVKISIFSVGVDDFHCGRYILSYIFTSKQVFKHVTLFSSSANWNNLELGTYVLATSSRIIDPKTYKGINRGNGNNLITGYPRDEAALDRYLAERESFLTTQPVIEDLNILDNIPYNLLPGPVPVVMD
jgi:hypothetical protein